MLSNFLAYPQKYHALEAIMRMQAVKRWHMIDTVRQQTLAEHSANVGLLAYYITLTSPHGSFESAADAMVYGMMHDIPESFTGDIPGHTKKFLTGLDSVEDTVTPSALKIAVPTNTKILVKLCDLADGIRFIRLHGIDVTSGHAQGQIEDQLANMFIYTNEVLKWTEDTREHVRDKIMFYAYEAARA